MTDGLPLFDLPPAQRHSVTSREAADRIEPAVGTLRRRVWECIRSRPSTDEEVQDLLAMPASTERPRRVELVSAGLVADSGETRLTRSGRRAVVWAAVR